MLQKIPLSPPAQAFEVQQRSWTGGEGRLRLDDDPAGYFNGTQLWTLTDGKLMPSPQFRFAKGIRTTSGWSDEDFPTDNSNLAWWKLYGSDPTNKITRYLSRSFSASASYNAVKAMIIVRRRGTPGTLTLELCTDSSGNPNTVLKTVTKISSAGNVVSGILVFNWSSSQALTSGTTYHVKMYGDSTDGLANHWEVLTNSSGSSSKYSTDNSSWSAANVSLFYRVVDTDVKRKWYFFNFDGHFYAVSQRDNGANSDLKTNGVRGTATAATASTLTDTNLSGVSTNQYQNAFIRIIDGTGDGQVKQIASNTSTQFTVSEDWDTTPGVTSRYIVYGTDTWTATTGTPALTVVKGPPAAADKICYFPQGQNTNMKRMRVNATSHDFADDGTNKADLVYLNPDPLTPKVYVANAAAAKLNTAATVTWSTNLTLSTTPVYVGSGDFRINRLFNHNRTLYAFKEDGPYKINGTQIEKIGGNFADIPDPSNGTAVASQNDYLWWNWAHSVERMLGSNVTDLMNWRTGFQGFDSARIGTISAIVSVVGWLFVAIDAGNSNYSSIMCWNGFGWHEIFRGWAGGRIRSMGWQACPETRGRLWFDISGEMACIEFPQFAANPLLDSTLNYHWEGALTTSTFDAHSPDLYKIIGTLRLLSDQGTAEVDYQTNADVGTGTWTVLGTMDSQPIEDLSVNTGGVFRIRFRIRLQVTNTRTPPIITELQLDGRTMSPAKFQWVGQFRAETDADTKTGEVDHNPNTVETQLITWATQQNKLTMRSLATNDDQKVVTVSMPARNYDWIDDTASGGRISFALIEV